MLLFKGVFCDLLLHSHTVLKENRVLYKWKPVAIICVQYLFFHLLGEMIVCTFGKFAF